MNLDAPDLPAGTLPGCHPEDVARMYLDRGWWIPETMLDLLDAGVAAHPDAPGVSDAPNLAEVGGLAPESLTWAELSARVDDIAARLYAAGVRPRDVVALFLPNSVALTATYFALWRLGAIATPMPLSFRSHEMTRILKGSGAVAVVTVATAGDREPAAEFEALEDRSNLRTVITLDGPAPGEDEVAQARAVAAGLTRSVNDCVTICWTSGTEGTPKGVPRCHGDWLSIARGVQDGLQTDESTVMLAPFPMVNMAGLATSILPWLLGGGHLVNHQPLDLQVFLGQLMQHRVTHTSMPPAILTMLFQRPELVELMKSSALQRVGSGGAPLPPGVVRRWQEELGIEVINFFGSNEGLCLLGAPADTPDPVLRAEMLPNYATAARGWSTVVAEQTQVRLVDLVTGEDVTEVGGRGELRLKGPTVFGGYLEGTAAASPFDEQGYLCSGDVFELAGEHGEYLKFVDRSKEIIIRGGMNISPAEIEGLLIDHPAVTDVAIVGYADEVMGEKCCAVVVPAEGRAPTVEDLSAFLHDLGVASFKHPERVKVVESLPRNPVGKLLRRELRTIAADPS